MSKQKKRHTNSSAAAKKQARANAIADQKDRARRRMNPTARNLLLGDLVFLAILSMLEKYTECPLLLINIGTILGALLIPVALYFQFSPKDRKSPRLK